MKLGWAQEVSQGITTQPLGGVTIPLILRVYIWDGPICFVQDLSTSGGPEGIFKVLALHSNECSPEASLLPARRTSSERPQGRGRGARMEPMNGSRDISFARWLQGGRAANPLALALAPE